MVIRFEERLGIDSSGWAREEANDATREVEPVVVVVPAGTPGQLFRMNLMQDLFTGLGKDEYIVNAEGEDTE